MIDLLCKIGFIACMLIACFVYLFIAYDFARTVIKRLRKRRKQKCGVSVIYDTPLSPMYCDKCGNSTGFHIIFTGDRANQDISPMNIKSVICTVCGHVLIGDKDD